MHSHDYRKEILLKKHLTYSYEKEEEMKIKRYKYILISQDMDII